MNLLAELNIQYNHNGLKQYVDNSEEININILEVFNRKNALALERRIYLILSS